MEIKMDMLDKLDMALTECLNDPGQINAEALIRFCYPVIQKHRNAGLKIESVAVILQGMGCKVTKGHLVRHLGKIIREQAAVKAACPESGKETATPAVRVNGGVKESGSSQSAVAVSADTAVLSTHIPEQVDISVPESITSSGSGRLKIEMISFLLSCLSSRLLKLQAKSMTSANQCRTVASNASGCRKRCL